MSEAALRQRVQEKLRGLQRAGEPVWWLKVHGHAMQRAGVPDFLLCVQGRFGALELKQPGEECTPQQTLELEWITDAGGLAGVAETEAHVDRFLDRLRV